MQRNLVISLACLCILNQCYADHTIPIFSGSWYLKANASPNKSACGKTIYQYAKLLSGSANSAAEAFAPSIEPGNTNCQWNPPKLLRDDASRPPDFLGTWDDWSTITSTKPTNQLPQVWEITSSNGPKDCIYNSIQFEIYPHYICPEGSRFTEGGSQTPGCSTTPDTCDADVVGRDLHVPAISWAGHVGMTESSWKVLEVLNDPIVIHTDDSFTDFKDQKKYPYWGDVYAPIGSKYSALNESLANKVLESGIDQTQYNPEYTYTAQWQAGGDYMNWVLNPRTQTWQKVRTYHRAIFRCDTFVDYCYKAGANIDIPTNQTYLPLNTYNSFTKQRLITTEPGIHITQNYIKNKTINLTPSLKNKRNTSSPLGSIETIVNRWKSDPHLTRIDKLSQLWQLSQEYQNSSVKFSYLIDTISFMHPIELESKLISMYTSVKNQAQKQKLLSAIGLGVQFNPSKKPGTLYIQSVKKTQDFTRSQLLAEKNPFLIKELIYLYAKIMPPEYSFELIRKKLRWLSNKNFTLNGKKYPYISMLLSNEIQLRIALMTETSQRKFFHSLVRTSQSIKTFLPALCLVLKNFNANHLIFDVKSESLKILTKHKITIKNFFKKNKRNFPNCPLSKILENLSR